MRKPKKPCMSWSDPERGEWYACVRRKPKLHDPDLCPHIAAGGAWESCEAGGAHMERPDGVNVKQASGNVKEDSKP